MFYTKGKKVHKKDKIMMNKNKLEGTEREVQKKRKIKMIEKKLDHAIRRSEKKRISFGGEENHCTEAIDGHWYPCHEHSTVLK